MRWERLNEIAHRIDTIYVIGKINAELLFMCDFEITSSFIKQLYYLIYFVASSQPNFEWNFIGIKPSSSDSHAQHGHIRNPFACFKNQQIAFAPFLRIMAV